MAVEQDCTSKLILDTNKLPYPRFNFRNEFTIKGETSLVNDHSNP